MPNYSYKCPSCGEGYTLRRAIDGRNHPVVCPPCDVECTRIVEANIQKYGNQQGMTEWERIRNRPR